MPIEMKDVQDGLGVVITGWGILTEEEFIDAFKKHLTQDKDKFRKYRYSLADYVALTEVAISNKALDLLADMCVRAAEINSEVVVATAADQDFPFGLSRMAHSLQFATGWKHHTFRNRQDAENWIKERVKEKFGLEDITFR